MTTQVEPTDKEIIDRYKKDRNDGFRLLYRKYSNKLLAVCQRYSADEGSAMDYLHEAMVKVNDKISSFKVREEGSLLRWMSKITVNMIIDAKRKEGHFHTVDISTEDIQTQAEPDQAIMIPVDEMYKMIGRLSDTRRVVFNLYCLEGHSRKEVAKELGITEDGVSSTLWKARKELSRMVMDYYKKESR